MKVQNAKSAHKNIAKTISGLRGRSKSWWWEPPKNVMFRHWGPRRRLFAYSPCSSRIHLTATLTPKADTHLCRTECIPNATILSRLVQITFDILRASWTRHIPAKWRWLALILSSGLAFRQLFQVGSLLETSVTRDKEMPSILYILPGNCAKARFLCADTNASAQ